MRSNRLLELLRAGWSSSHRWSVLPGLMYCCSEIAGSLRLYGGLLSLRQQIAAGLRATGLRSVAGDCTDTARGDLAGKSGRRACIREPANIAAALRDLPLACLDWPAAICESIGAHGRSNIGDCLRLPREGFARRFGSQRLLELDRALGRLPDPRAILART